jgi:hypothetical protein
MIWNGAAVYGTSVTVNNHVYVKGAAAFDAPNADVAGLVAAGAASIALSGPSDPPGQPFFNRPAPGEGAAVGQLYMDTTLGKLIAWNGDRWVDPVTGFPV